MLIPILKQIEYGLHKESTMVLSKIHLLQDGYKLECRCPRKLPTPASERRPREAVPSAAPKLQAAAAAADGDERLKLQPNSWGGPHTA